VIQVSNQQLKIGLTLTGNGRWDYMNPSLESIQRYLLKNFQFDYKVVVDDSGQPDSWERTLERFKGWNTIVHGEPMGLAKAVQAVWESVPEDIDYIFHTEDDFTFKKVPNLVKMIKILETNNNLSEVTLKRQAVNSEEIQAGGYVETNPNAYQECNLDGIKYITHNLFFSLNPSVIPRRIFADIGWPNENEAGMIAMLKAAGYKSAIWGSKFDDPVIQHIGHHRTSWWKE
jgi:hypothetical protein